MPGGWANAVLGQRRGQRIALTAAGVSVLVFLVWSAIRIHGLLAVLYQNSDVASAPVIAELFGERGSGVVTLGYYPWLEPLYALRLTSWLPDHRAAWEVLPFLVFGGTVVLAGWTVRRAVSTAAGMAVALAMAAPAPLVIWFLGAPNMRLFTLAHAVILGAFVVTLPSVERWGKLRRAAWLIALAALLAIGASSDPLVLIGAAGPFAVAVLCCWGLGVVRRAPAILALCGAVLGTAGGWLLERFAEHHGIVYDKRSFGLTSFHDAISNTGLLLQDVALFAHGRLGGTDTLGHFLEVVAWAAFILAPVAALLALRRIPGLIRSDQRAASQRLLLAYWSLAALAIAIVLVASTAAEDISAIRYMTILWPAMLTVAVICWPLRGTTAAACLALFCAVVGFFELAGNRYAAGDPRSPQGAEVEQLARLVQRERLDHGYAAYWDAAALTDRTGFRARTYPIQDCGPQQALRCQWYFHTIESWYQPKPGVRSFYLRNDTGLPNELGPPPRSWGRPASVVRLGHLTVYIYDFDLAGKLRLPSG